MKDVFRVGDTVRYARVVQPADVASFHGNVVHHVCSTFALARDIEWTTRQFVLGMRDDDEEGIGTFLSIEHKAPAFVGDEVVFVGTVERIEGNELLCSFEARVRDRLVACGKTGQKILKKEKIRKLFGE